jgi:hypothetical protein
MTSARFTREVHYRSKHAAARTPTCISGGTRPPDLHPATNIYIPLSFGITSSLAHCQRCQHRYSKWGKAGGVFGGFLVKADSEGNVGPLSYNATEADGANLIARAVEPHGGFVMWRAFVYGNSDFGAEELVQQSYSTFHPLDGAFDARCSLWFFCRNLWVEA